MFVSVFVLDAVISVPVVGSVTFVAPVVVRVKALAPDVAKFPARVRVPVVTDCAVPPALIMTAFEPLPERSGSFPKAVCIRSYSALMVELVPLELDAGAPVES